MKSFLSIGIPMGKDFSITSKNWESATELAIYVKLVTVYWLNFTALLSMLTSFSMNL